MKNYKINFIILMKQALSISNLFGLALNETKETNENLYCLVLRFNFVRFKVNIDYFYRLFSTLYLNRTQKLSQLLNKSD